jgi:hypothetical protein
LAFFLFLLVTASLFIRPAEIVPDLVGLPVYNVLISTCLVVAFPVIQAQLSPRALVNDPISMCVVGMEAAVILSHLSHLEHYYARIFGLEFFKVVLYYLLLVGLLDTRARFCRFLTCLLGCVTAMTLVAVLRYHGMVALPSMYSVERIEYNFATGQLYKVLQMTGSGIFADPNDLCLALVLGMGIAVSKIGDRRAGLLRILWLAPLGLFLYALSLTHSRGGFLGMLLSMLALFVARFGWRKSVPLGALALPVMLYLFAGRQTDITTGSGTGQSRIQLWALSLETFQRAPFFGIGQGLLADAIGHESHNSFVHCYPDMGFFGGTLFLGIFYLACQALYERRPSHALVVDPELRRLRPYLVAILFGCIGGMMSISRAYIVPTYMVPGFVAAYQRLAVTAPPLPSRRFNGRLVLRLVVVSVAFLVLVKLYVRFFARWG